MAYQPSSIQGWMDEKDLCWLHDQAAQMDSVVEVGSWRGRSTHALLSGCRGAVFAVDHFKGSPNELHSAHKDALTRDIFKEFWVNVGGFTNLVVMRMESHRAAAFFADRSVDMVFIDACHTREAVLMDLKSWVPKCRKLMCGHDEGYKDVQAALRDRFGKPWEKAGGIWFIYV